MFLVVYILFQNQKRESVHDFAKGYNHNIFLMRNLD
jgi:hypothetical protein